MKNILITGATGFVGSFLVEEALRKGYRVFAAIRSTSNLKYIADQAIHLVNLDLTKKESMVKELYQIKRKYGVFDAIIHNAGITEAVDVKDYFEVNFQGTVNLVETLKGIQMLSTKFVYISSLAAQGPNKIIGDIATELAHPSPTSSYGKSKWLAEQYLLNQTDLDFVVLRPTGVYGPRNMGYLSYFKLIKNGLEIYLNTKYQQLSFIYVEDIAAVALIAAEKKTQSKVFIVSDGSNYSCHAFASLLKKAFHKQTLKLVIPKELVQLVCSFNSAFSKISKRSTLLNKDKYHELVASSWACSSIKMRKELGFIPQTKLEEGINKSIIWYQQNKLL